MFFRLFSALVSLAAQGLYWIICGIPHNFAWDPAQVFVGSLACSDGKGINTLWERHQVRSQLIHMLISERLSVAISSPDAIMGNYFLPIKVSDEHCFAEKIQKKGKYQAVQ
ncbi:hypothetical protein [Pantoea sp. Morm]|uniref:hypothetical protein n=1 Tax=Pantoea sp. Morm TaxID=2601250 RepID=UPI0031FBE216